MINEQDFVEVELTINDTNLIDTIDYMADVLQITPNEMASRIVVHMINKFKRVPCNE